MMTRPTAAQGTCRRGQKDSQCQIHSSLLDGLALAGYLLTWTENPSVYALAVIFHMVVVTMCFSAGDFIQSEPH